MRTANKQINNELRLAGNQTTGNMFRPFLLFLILLLCAFAFAAGQTLQTLSQQPQTQQPSVQQQTALPPEAITEPVRAIKAPRTPLPSEKDSARGNRVS